MQKKIALTSLENYAFLVLKIYKKTLLLWLLKGDDMNGGHDIVIFLLDLLEAENSI